MYNNEHYKDPTAGNALENIEYERIRKTIKDIKHIINRSEFELLNRIVLRDKKTGKIYK